MARSGTSAWLPKRPGEIPASGSARFHRVAEGSRSPTEGKGRRTRPFRFGSEEIGDPDPPLEPGTFVGGRYRIIRLLGEGGMGRVYEAEHSVLERRVALKLLRRDAAAAQESLARFQREALAASRIGAPQIVEVVDFDSHMSASGRQTYMVMELLEGQSLEQWMEQPQSLDQGLELFAQLSEGLAAAHQAGVIHRDIKPANVFCRAPDETAAIRGTRIKILDFGIAKITAGGAGFQTQRGALLGTPYYLAPERVMGATLSPAADIYSVGVMTYELLTGNVPFVADSFMGILARHVHDEPLDPRQAAPERGIPDAIANLAMRLLAKDPSERPSAEALALELREHQQRLGPILAGVHTGPRDSSAGSDTQTQALTTDTQALEEAMDQRATLAPDASGVAEPATHASLGAASSGPRTRATAIGHASAALPIARPAPGSATPLESGGLAESNAVSPTRRSLGLGAALGVVLVGLGGLALRCTMERSPLTEAAREEPAARSEASALSASPREARNNEIEAETPPKPEGGEVSAPAPEPEAKVVKGSEEPPQGASGHAPRERLGPAAKRSKPAPPSDPEPTPKPAEKPKIPDPSPTPEPASDSQLPTIKDDVYD